MPKKAIAWIVAGGICAWPAYSWPQTENSAGQPDAPAAAKKKTAHKKLDRSGKPKKGKASYYGGKRFAGKTMADGTPMKPHEHIAASRTLPLGTKAEVINLQNGKGSVVEIRDRGPYVDGRIIDVSPKVASELDMKKDGVVSVIVNPIELPPEDGKKITENGKP